MQYDFNLYTGPFAFAEDAMEISNEGERYVPLAIPYNAAMHLGHMASYKLALRFAYGGRILDLGCGTGYGSHFLASHGVAHVVAADFDETALSYARKNYPHPSIKHLRLDGNEPLPFEDNTFDFVFCSQVIEHIREPQELLKEFRRVLKDGGFCLVTEPNQEIFSPDPDHNPNEHHISEMNFSQFESAGNAVFPKIKMAGIPQNCLLINPDNTQDVKSNEEIAPEDFRVVYDNAAACENLLLFGHTLGNGKFSETIRDELREISDDPAPYFFDASASNGQWVKLGGFPKTPSETDTVIQAAGSVRTEIYSPYNSLYRVEVALLNGGDYPFDVRLRRDKPDGPVVYQGQASACRGRLSLLFSPIADSAETTFYLELRFQGNFLNRFIKRSRVPRFQYRNHRLPVWTFHRVQNQS
jgi:SAM-dependent methyltransferase